jgi:glutaredoxin
MVMKIILYGTESCPECKRAKSFFEENQIKFEYIDVGKNKKEANRIIEKTCQRKVPVIEINDEMIIRFDETKILKKLGL